MLSRTHIFSRSGYTVVSLFLHQKKKKKKHTVSSIPNGFKKPPAIQWRSASGIFEIVFKFFLLS